MDTIQNVIFLVIATTGFWALVALQRRISLLEHEVRWLRQELETLKPTEVVSEFDPKPRAQ